MVASTAAANVGDFALSLLYPILLYLICAAALPDACLLRHGRDLLIAYFAESRYFFILIVL